MNLGILRKHAAIQSNNVEQCWLSCCYMDDYFTLFWIETVTVTQVKTECGTHMIT